MIELFALARVASRLSPGDGYATMRSAADAILGVGINMATKMLCTFAPVRYAIYNGNTVMALSTLGAAAALPRSARVLVLPTYRKRMNSGIGFTGGSKSASRSHG